MFLSSLSPVMMNKLGHWEGFVTAGVLIALDLVIMAC